MVDLSADEAVRRLAQLDRMIELAKAVREYEVEAVLWRARARVVAWQAEAAVR